MLKIFVLLRYLNSGIGDEARCFCKYSPVLKTKINLNLKKKKSDYNTD